MPVSQIVSKQSYQPGTTTLAAQVTALKASKATVVVNFTVPIYTAISQLTSFTLGYKPQLVVSNVGIDPTTVGALLKSVSKGFRCSCDANCFGVGDDFWRARGSQADVTERGAR